ncbi:MAG: hypothetical protein OCU12_00800 [Methanophagales archaeon]|nr:hypothetical protein [Methanophagales archaeon]
MKVADVQAFPDDLSERTSGQRRARATSGQRRARARSRKSFF